MRTLITVDGPDGVGKSTFVQNLYNLFQPMEDEVVTMGTNQRPLKLVKAKFPTAYPTGNFATSKDIAQYYINDFKNWRREKGRTGYSKIKDYHTIFIFDRSHISTLVYNCFFVPGQTNVINKRVPIEDWTLKYKSAFDKVMSAYENFIDRMNLDEICHVLFTQSKKALLDNPRDESGDITDQLDDETRNRRLKNLKKLFDRCKMFDVGIETRKTKKKSYIDSMHRRQIEHNHYWKSEQEILFEFFKKSNVAHRTLLRLLH